MTTVMPLVSLALALANLGIWTLVVVVSIREWRRFHDDRAARGVLLALVLVAASLGSAITALGFYVISEGATEVEIVAGLASVARGAMIAGGVAYLASLRQRGDRRDG